MSIRTGGLPRLKIKKLAAKAKRLVRNSVPKNRVPVIGHSPVFSPAALVRKVRQDEKRALEGRKAA